jgi:L-seryl-tRNA(Ser) seleniumtransferase
MSKLQDLRKIPSVSEALEAALREPWSQEYSRNRIVRGIREELAEVRLSVRKQKQQVPSLQKLLRRFQERLKRAHSLSLRGVINATGVIVHTNLGRAPLPEEAISHLAETGAYSNLEFDLLEGKRGSREIHAENLLLNLLPAEAALVVNNNAAALLLILNTLAEDKEVIVSRGELVEIGGSFRLPEIMKKSGAILKEIGTTNKTRLQDYRKALSDRTGMILVVHPSNYQIIGFTEKPALHEVVTVGKEQNIPVVEDHGSGILLELEPFGISDEPTVQNRLREGADLVCFSGDKILGGPQAGIVCGKKLLVQQLRNNPLFRALRVNKTAYAALEATLLLYLRNDISRIPVIRMLAQSEQVLRTRGQKWLAGLQDKFPACNWSLEMTTNYIGGGVAPMKALLSYAIAISSTEVSPQDLARRLRESEPPVVARIEEDRVLFELRTINIVEQNQIESALDKILKQRL